MTETFSRCWAIVQLAGRRILVPLIVVQVHVAQPTRTQTSPSSSRPRTAAFHAVNSGSNPLGDANRHLKAHHIPPKLRFCGAPFVLSRPCKALPPGPQAAPLSPAPPRPAAFWKKLPLRPKTPSPSCSRRNLRHEDGAFIRQAYGLRAALFFPAHRMYAPPLAAPKGPSARFESAS